MPVFAFALGLMGTAVDRALVRSRGAGASMPSSTTVRARAAEPVDRKTHADVKAPIRRPANTGRVDRGLTLLRSFPRRRESSLFFPKLSSVPAFAGTSGSERT